MSTTRIAVSAGQPRAHVDLIVGALAPRLISRDSCSAHIALTAAEMLLLGGDRVRIQIEVGADCLLEIDDVGGTVAYPSRGASSHWIVDVTIHAGGVLRWHSLPFVVAEGADVERRTSILLHPGSRALVRETVVLGRHGEVGGHLLSRFGASDPGGPILVEQLNVDGAVAEPGVLGDFRVVDAVIALGFRPETAPGHLVLDQPGALARHLGAELHESRMDATWAAWSAMVEQAHVGPAPSLSGAGAG